MTISATQFNEAHFSASQTELLLKMQKQVTSYQSSVEDRINDLGLQQMKFEEVLNKVYQRQDELYQRQDKLDQKVNNLDQKVNNLDQKFNKLVNTLDVKFNDLDQKINKIFVALNIEK